MTHARSMQAERSDSPGAAPAHRRVLSQGRYEAATLLRNGEQLLVSVILPLMALGVLVYVGVPGMPQYPAVDAAVPGVLALAIASTAFTGQAISTGFDRRNGVLRYLGVTPLGRSGLLLGKALAVLVIEALLVVVIGGVGWALGWSPATAGVLPAVGFWLVGTWAFVAFALLLAGSMRAEAVLALANLVWLVLLGLGGLVFPASVLPAPVAAVAQWLPSAALGDGLRAALAGGGFASAEFATLLAWALLATLVTVKVFRWSD